MRRATRAILGSAVVGGFALLVDAGRVVSTDRLVDHLWGERPPPTARALLQGCVAELRRTLRRTGRQCLVTRAPGYVLEVRPGELDADRFEELAAAAVGAATPAEAAALLYRALELWRGPVLDDVAVDELSTADSDGLPRLLLELVAALRATDAVAVDVRSCRPDVFTQLGSDDGDREGDRFVVRF